ncbi:MAG: hypothetical protein Q8K99_09265 [Actinomycetota bacterium]|nr:hypothetical protein [Actinomycetota bacterium]
MRDPAVWRRCTLPSWVYFEDLTRGGATVNLKALDPGTYGFSCGMEMASGTLVVE